MNNRKGIQTFTIIWFGQLVSLLGTGMTRFALLIWAYQETGNATTVALLGFFSYVPFVAVSPVAGVLVDRWDRRKVMIGADLGAGVMTIIILSLYAVDGLAIWHLYVAQALAGLFEAFQYPAYAAATTMLVPKEHYGRVNGMRSLAASIAEVFAPILAGLLLVVIDIDGVMWIDVGTFLTAMMTLIFVTIPKPRVSAADETAEGHSFRHQLLFGIRYINQRPGLRGLLLIFMGINFFAAVTYYAILPAMILARSGGSEFALGSVQAMLGAAGVVGGIAVSIWGGPKRRIHGILAFAAVSFLAGDLLFAVGQSLPVWLLAAGVAAFFVPFIVAANRSIWQSKVDPAVQGRVFSVQTALQQLTMPLGYLVAGPLADYVFEPAMQLGGGLENTFGWLLGRGDGAGMGFMFMCTAILGCLMSLSGYLFPAVRNVEIDLPDHELELSDFEELLELETA
ncbi:MAG: MFS transporter [Anaerolineales bacterium]|nr:MFS transporter [Anaerolineales bacterium]